MIAMIISLVALVLATAMNVKTSRDLKAQRKQDTKVDSEVYRNEFYKG